VLYCFQESSKCSLLGGTEVAMSKIERIIKLFENLHVRELNRKNIKLDDIDFIEVSVTYE